MSKFVRTKVTNETAARARYVATRANVPLPSVYGMALEQYFLSADLVEFSRLLEDARNQLDKFTEVYSSDDLREDD